ncbi:hypothetical protein EOPP23_08790 [Endozoicomonas sp. OPT23]|uniref:YbaN family protein n=1 Tax=Endozoicomonas sp. OPT23 TaxID=2072845 RepID=UPI00129B0FAA|nr:YbaN family protein [Endozoicomonas sp. OPT23]MRI33078.1 hypothetical protein [Endozoicomonas sp. OPT23]
MLKIFLIFAGILSLVAGVIGIFLPLLPTTPFLLLSAFCFARSSEKLHQWLLNHPYFGRVLSNWEKHRGMEAKHKKRALIFTTISFAVSIYFAPLLAVKIMLVVMSVCVLTGISRMRTLPVDIRQDNQ